MPEDLYYHKEHMWVRVEDGKAIVGLTDFNQKAAGELSFIELPMEGDEVSKDEVVGSFETGKWLGKIYAPVSGTVTKVNEELEDDPSIVNKDPYGEGWLFEIEMSNPDELKELMKGDSDEVVEWLKKEIEKIKK
ncbi:MAG TPA: glycine cleavage system protein GcvH [candidate division WOR-3 bacterium]|uniref:Glycine cleavage system H protein n=1 Tax=candidate division WOR-3 bacterium TaxID=2052148 RepID=A0A7C0XE32_UNCW3|nr:glycine cleavage system protein GcvH [candidate division WOR-3 bacterium]